MADTLVIGGNGFLGSHVVDALARRGHRVAAFDRFGVLKPQFVEPGVDVISGDFLNAADLRSAVAGRDVVLGLEDAGALEIPVVGLGPEPRSALHVDELGAHPHRGAPLADAPFQRVARAEPAVQAVESGKTYHYRVCQYDGSGCVSYSNAVSLAVPGGWVTEEKVVSAAPVVSLEDVEVVVGLSIGRHHFVSTHKRKSASRRSNRKRIYLMVRSQATRAYLAYPITDRQAEFEPPSQLMVSGKFGDRSGLPVHRSRYLLVRATC